MALAQRLVGKLVEQGRQDERELRAIYQPAFPQLFGELPAGHSASTVLWDEQKKSFASVKWGQAWLAPRGVGPNAWNRSERKQSQIHRRFMLLGQTPDGMRVWDTIAAARLLREKPGAAKVPLRMTGRGNAAVVALYAKLFVPDVLEMELLDLPVSHMRSGPDFLNVARYTDIPETLAFAAERSRTMLFLDASVKDREDPLVGFTRRTATALGWNGRRLEVSDATGEQGGPRVSAEVMFNGEAVKRGELAIYPQDEAADGVPWLLALDRPGAIPERADGVVMPLPVGKARVAIRDAGGVPHKFGLPDSTPLVVEIVDGENQLSFQIKD